MNNNNKEWNIFICHASEDKETIVDQLAKDLEKLGLNVWYDKKSTLFGDEINQEVIDGLSKTRYAIIVFSKNFYKKIYPLYESGIIMYRILMKQNIIPIPILYKVNKEIVKEKSPFFFKHKSLIIKNNNNISTHAIELYNDLKEHEINFNEKIKRENESRRLFEEIIVERKNINNLIKKNHIKYIFALFLSILLAVVIIFLLSKNYEKQSFPPIIKNDTLFIDNIIIGKIVDSFDSPIKNAKVEILESVNGAV